MRERSVVFERLAASVCAILPPGTVIFVTHKLMLTPACKRPVFSFVGNKS